MTSRSPILDAAARLRAGWRWLPGGVRRILGWVLFALACFAVGMGPSLRLAHEQAGSWWGIAFPDPERNVVLGGGIDFVGTVWTYDRVRRLVLPWHAPMPPVFAPVGMNVAVAQGAAWLDAIAAMPLVELLGPTGFYNVWLLVVLVGAQLSTVALLRGAGAGRLTAAVISYAVVYNAMMMKELNQGRPTQVWIVPHALFLLALVHLLRRPGVRAGLLAGLSLAAACLTYWFSGVALGVLGALRWLLALVRAPDRLALLRGGLVLAGTALAAATLGAWPAVRHVLAGAPVQGTMEPLRITLPLLGLPVEVSPPVLALRPRTFFDWLSSEGPSPTLFALGVAAVLLGGRRARTWGLLGLFLSTASLGGALALSPEGGDAIPTALALLDLVFPPMLRNQFPRRMMVVPHLAFALAAAFALREGGRRLDPAWRKLLPAGLAAATLLGLRVERAHDDLFHAVLAWRHAGFYREVAARFPGAIIDVPIEDSNLHYAYQVVHGRAVLGGPGILGHKTEPPEHRAYVADNTFLQTLAALAHASVPPESDPADRRRLVEDGFGVVVVHLRDSAAPGRAYARLLGPDYLAAGDLVAFPLRPPP